MEQLTINFISPQIDRVQTDLCVLRICIGPDSLFYSVRDLSNSCYLLKSKSFLSENASEVIQNALTQDAFLRNVYQEVEIYWFSKVETYIPKRMFVENSAGSYLSSITDQPLGELCMEEISSAQLVFLCSLPPIVFNSIKKQFPNAKNNLQTAQLVRHWLTELPHKTRLFLHIHPRHIQIAAFENQNLQFINSFGYDKPADVLYFVLLVYQQLQLNTESIELSISGELLQNSEIYKQLHQFIGKIRFTSTPTLFGLPNNIQSHTYINQIIN